MNQPRGQIANLTDFTGLQNDCLHVLSSMTALRHVNIIEERKFLVGSDVEITSLWQTPRAMGGPVGAGIIVEMVKASVDSPNVTGPIFNLEFGFAVLEERNLNLSPGVGTMLTAEQICQLILDCLHLYPLASGSTLKAAGIEVANDWIDTDSGIVAHRAKLTMLNGRTQTARCGFVSATIAAGSCTLSTTTSGADIYYALGGQDADLNWLEPAMPAPSNTGQGAQLYSGAFAIASGQIVRAAAYAQNYNPGPVLRKVAA